jgi:6-phosphogluconolactonase/glucosamine-6-phosphate isomerase/deaminase
VTVPELVFLRDPEEVVQRAAALVAESGLAAVAERGAFTLALSRPCEGLIEALAAAEVPWERVTTYQVDERIAPRGSQARNIELVDGKLPGRLVPMPVDDDDVEAAAARYGEELPDRLDLVHLGLGPDGHTASLVPDDPVLDVVDRDVAVTGEYHRYRRMTLTYPALNRARAAVWIITGESKSDALAKLLAGAEDIPASRVGTGVQTVLADVAARG